VEYGPMGGPAGWIPPEAGGPGEIVPPGHAPAAESADRAWGGGVPPEGAGRVGPPGQYSVPAGSGPGVVNPNWLAATADRERAAGVLRAGFAEGRLTQDELDDRLARVYAARTYGELWALTADLPAGPMPVPFQHSAPPPATYDPGDSPAAWRSAAALIFTALVIFALAALVTAIITAHAQQVVYPFQNVPFGQVHVLPFITHPGS
jgi:Domain of unknown function (DUF1707)